MTIFQVFLTLTILIIASAFDLKTREVPNRIWIISFPISIITISTHLLSNPDQLFISLVSVAITTTIAIAIFYLGLFGGADAKALITLSIVHPISTNSLLSIPLLPLTTFNNSLILMVLTAPLVFIRNIYWKMTRHKSLFQGFEKDPIWKKGAALLFCIKKTKSEIKPYHTIAETRMSHNGEVYRTLNIFQRVSEEDTKIDDTLPDDIFVVFSLPMLPFLTFAYVLGISVGDLILHLLTIFLNLPRLQI